MVINTEMLFSSLQTKIMSCNTGCTPHPENTGRISTVEEWDWHSTKMAIANKWDNNQLVKITIDFKKMMLLRN